MKAAVVVFGDQMVDAMAVDDSTPSETVPFLSLNSIRGAEAGDRLQVWRTRLGLSKAELSRRSGVSVRAITQLETDPGGAVFGRIKNVCEALCDEFATQVGISVSDEAIGDEAQNAIGASGQVVKKALGWSVKTPQAVKALVELGEKFIS